MVVSYVGSARKAAPWPRPLSTQVRPLCFSIIACAIVRPSSPASLFQVHSVEAFKDGFALLRRDARPIILYHQPHLIGGSEPAYRYVGARGRMPVSVIEQVDNYLFQFALVAPVRQYTFRR